MAKRVRRSTAPSLVEILRQRAELQGERTALTFLDTGEGEDQSLTYQEFDRRSRALAASLKGLVRPGDRILICCPPGMSYVIGFFGALYAGAVAVPAFPPRVNRTLERVRLIAAGARPKVVLAESEQLRKRDVWVDKAPDLASLPWRDISEVPALESEWRNPSVDRGDLAFLQYTSGSTASPKGVMVQHGNLLANCEAIRRAFRLTTRSRVISWLPLFHDMGLIGNLLGSVSIGFHLHLMPPAFFVQRPVRWLQAISRYRGTVSGGPNFAYDLCARQISEGDLEGIDLSSWRTAFNGAEPVRSGTLDRFVRRFAPRGFKRSAFLPCYGLAEATLFVSGGPPAGGPVERPLSPAALEGHRAVAPAEGEQAFPAVASGEVDPAADLRIVDPETSRPVLEDGVGEIWVRGPSVAAGYFGQAEATARDFEAKLADGEGGFLRTGDLGFLHGGQLFVTGRLKDLLIVRGRNLYPQDIEAAVEGSHELFRPGCSAAFLVEGDGEPRLVVVAELQGGKGLDLEALDAAARQAVARAHDVALAQLVPVRRSSLPKTSSGKVQRRRCRDLYLEEGLRVLRPRPPAGPSAGPEAESSAPDGPASSLPCAASSDRRAGALEDRLRQLVAAYLRKSAAEVDRRRPFAALGLDSVALVRLSGELEAELGRPLAPTLLYEHPTIESLAAALDGPREAAPPGRGARGTGDAAGGSLPAEPMAVVGIGCRFPGAHGPGELWRNLSEGRDSIGVVPARRWPVDDLYDPDFRRPGKMSTRWGGFLEGVDLFDPGFFGISPREALRMDPQQRLLLETAWEALEDAGLPRQAVAGSSTGIFLGISGTEYGARQLEDPDLGDAFVGTGSALSIAANRLSYWLDLRGPSLAVDTACSSSLVALDLALQALRRGRCEQALVAGANLILSPGLTVSFSKGGFMAPDGRCKAFDAKADGYVRGEGVGVVVLKPLARAREDGDRIYALCLGSAVNQDGRSNGLTAPNPAAQEAVLRAAYRDAGVAPGQVGYVEAHGTGTALGDPIEVSALGRVLGEGRPADRDCRIGSIKTNIGHLEPAAGIAGLIKAALALAKGQIPPSLHFEEPNPRIPFEELPIRVARDLEPWPATERPRFAGVSSFGFGGTNAHAVLGEAPTTPGEVAQEEADGPRLLPLSAQDPSALEALAGAYIRRLEASPELPLGDLCHSAAHRRSALDQRLTVAFRNRRELLRSLSRVAEGKTAAGVSRGRLRSAAAPRIAVVFPGHGPQWVGMGRKLLAEEAVFRQAFEGCGKVLEPYLDRPLTELFLDGSGKALERVDHLQMLLFALQVALVEQWKAWGVTPQAVVGHSIGEVSAAWAAGILSLEGAAAVVGERARLIRPLSGTGGMLAVGLSPERVRRRLGSAPGDPVVAAFNGPSAAVVSGPVAALEDLRRELDSEGVSCRRVGIAYPSHSPAMAALEGPLKAALASLAASSGNVPLASTVTGSLVDGSTLGSSHWAHNLSRPVRFQEAVEALLGEGCNVFLEVSAHPVLTRPLGRIAAGEETLTVGSLRRDGDDGVELRRALGTLFCQGVDVDWEAVAPAGSFVPLPSYPWQRRAFWIEDPRRGAPQGTGPAPTAAAAMAPAATAPEHRSGHDLHRQLQGIVAELLEMEPSAVDVHQPFLEMGADSLVMLDTLRLIKERFGVAPAVRDLFGDLSTIDAVAGFLRQHAVAPEPDRDAPPAVPGPDGPAPGAESSASLTERVIARQLETLERLMESQLAALGAGPGTVPDPRPAEVAERAADVAGVAGSASATLDGTGSREAPVAPFNPFMGIDLGRRRLSAEQRAHLEGLIAAVTGRTPRSKEHNQRHRLRLADNRASAGFRFDVKEMLYPLVAERSEGPHIWDLDGNRYVDLSMGFGIGLFGHNPAFIREAIEAQLARGVHVGPQSDLAGEVAELFHDGEIKGTAHSYVGEEAIASAVGQLLREDDYMASNHRGHGHCIAKGADLDRMMAELMGRETGYCRGLGGSMHIADMDLNILGANGIVGAAMPLSCGAALAARLRGKGQVVVAFFGDGANNQGIFHESMNLAAVWKLPMVFVCENNQYALSTSYKRTTAVENVALRAPAYGVPGQTIDGNDVVEV